MMMRNSILVLLVLGLFLVLAACSSQSPPEPLEMSIDMHEYAFEPADLEFRVGQEVTLQLTNSGALEHEIMFGREVVTTDGRPNGYEVDMFESAGIEPVVTVEKSEKGESEEEHMEGDEHQEDDEHQEEDEHSEGDEHSEDEHAEDEHAHAGFMVQVPASHDVYTMKFTVTEDMLGEWEVGCFLLDGVHYTSGMVGSLTVTN
jgi:plastocyanin